MGPLRVCCEDLIAVNSSVDLCARERGDEWSHHRSKNKLCRDSRVERTRKAVLDTIFSTSSTNIVAT
jgi:hypothetical protein